MKLHRAIAAPFAFIFFTSLMLILYTYLKPPFLDETALNAIAAGRLPGDLPQYILRFLLSFLLLGILPLITVRIVGFRLRELGLVIKSRNLKPLLFVLFLAAALGAGIASAFNADLAAYYPYSKTIASFVKGGSYSWLFWHALAYFFLYYLPWEFFFRGFLVFPLLALFKVPAPEWTLRNPKAAAIVCLQAVPSALLHFGHPLSETLSAVFFGLFAGWLVLRTRSILPGLILHAAVGIALDCTIMLIK